MLQSLHIENIAVIERCSIDFNRGLNVLTGETGAGKSTLLKVISGILRPTEGSVSLNGNVVPMLELGSGFDFDLTGRENIFLNGAVLGFAKDHMMEKFDDIVDFSELHDFLCRFSRA